MASTTLDEPTGTTSDDVATTPEAPSQGVSHQTAARALVTLAMVGTALIHFAYAPGHLDVETSHGVFFVVIGWLGIVFAAGTLLRARPERAWLAATALFNLGVVAVWLISRTVGVPGSDREAVSFPDATATVLELVAAVAAVALLVGLLKASGSIGRGSFLGLSGAAAVATVAVVSMAVTPSFAGDHGVAGHAHGGAGDEMAGGHGHGAGDDAHAAGDEAHAAGEGEMAADDWAQTRFNALAGYASDAEIEQFKQVEADYLAEQIRARSDLLRGMPEAEVEERIATYTAWAVENTIALLEGAQSNGEAGMHSHGPQPWIPIDDPGDQRKLQEQLAASATVIDRYPTVAEAEAAGYYQISPYVPGIAAHWINGDFDSEFDAAQPEMLLYNGTDKTSRLVGLSYATIGDTPPEGFVGPNDTWHAHPGLCMLGGFVVGIDGTPEELCSSIGGEIARGLSNLQMMHLWQVPGWESSWGLFSAENDKINVATSDIGRSLAG